MLKLKNVFLKTKKLYNESDYYIKIKLLFEDRDFLNNICYWSTLDSKGSLMEIGLEKSSGLIFEICVVIGNTTRICTARLIFTTSYNIDT